MENKLYLIRHGQSTYNLENRFTGWKDVDLTNLGINQAKEAAKLLKGHKFDIAFTSNLLRAQKTLDIILNELELNLEIIKNSQDTETLKGEIYWYKNIPQEVEYLFPKYILCKYI